MSRGRPATSLDDEDERHDEFDERKSDAGEPGELPPPDAPRPSTAALRTSGNKEDNIQVLCRFRPENARELAEGGPDSSVEFEPASGDGSAGEGVHVMLEGRHASYRFDRVFQPYATQADVFEAVGVATVKAVLDGYNSAILAYGQTGSGKTYSMMGPGHDGRALDADDAVMGDPGLIPRVMQTLFSHISALESDTLHFQLRASYIEIYQENVRDLLNPLPEGPSRHAKLSLEIRQDAQRGMLLPDATEVPLYTLQDVFSTLRIGGRHRKVVATKANESSSRSHAILLVTLHRFNVVTNVTKLSQLYLCDLAGSEKVEKTEVSGLQLQEANRINHGLLALGQVIQALVQQSKTKRMVHIPYRSSRLTRLLSNCVGGNSRTSLLINCSPAAYNLRETLSTLRFGAQMKRIKNHATVNVHIGVAELKALLAASQRENEQLKRTMAQLQTEIKLMHEVNKFETAVRNNNAAPMNTPYGRSGWESPDLDAFDQEGAASDAEPGADFFSSPSSLSSPPPKRPSTSPSDRNLMFVPRVETHSPSNMGSPASSSSASRCSTSSTSPFSTFSPSPTQEDSTASASSSSSSPPSSLPSSATPRRPNPVAAAAAPSPSPGPPPRSAVDLAAASRAGDSRASTEPTLVSVKEPEECKQRDSQQSAEPQNEREVLRAALQAEMREVRQSPGQRLLAAYTAPRIDRASTSDLRQLLLHFLCPLSKRVMADPVIAIDGHTYERRPMQTYLLTHSTSPVTGQTLTSKLLIPNIGLQQQIRKFYPQSLLQQQQQRKTMGGSAGFLSVDGFDAAYLSCLPLAVLSYLCEFLDHKSLCRLAHCSRELLSVSGENRLWKLLILRREWPLDGALIREHGSRVKTYFKTLYKQRVVSLSSAERARRAAAQEREWRGVYLVPKPTGGVADVHVQLN